MDDFLARKTTQLLNVCLLYEQAWLPSVEDPPELHSAVQAVLVIQASHSVHFFAAPFLFARPNTELPGQCLPNGGSTREVDTRVQLHLFGNAGCVPSTARSQCFTSYQRPDQRESCLGR